MKQDRVTRRRFLVMTGTLAAAAVAAGAACAGCAGAVEASNTASTQSVPMTGAQNVRTACPRGLVNDPYPGHCRLYRDNNGNGYCDLSQIEA